MRIQRQCWPTAGCSHHTRLSHSLLAEQVAERVARRRGRASRLPLAANGSPQIVATTSTNSNHGCPVGGSAMHAYLEARTPCISTDLRRKSAAPRCVGCKGVHQAFVAPTRCQPPEKQFRRALLSIGKKVKGTCGCTRTQDTSTHASPHASQTPAIGRSACSSLGWRKATQASPEIRSIRRSNASETYLRVSIGPDTMYVSQRI